MRAAPANAHELRFRAKWKEHGLRHEVTDWEEDVARVRIGRACAAIGVASLAVALPAIPIAAVAGVLRAGMAPTAAWLAAALAVLRGGGKVAAGAVGAARVIAAPGLRASAASTD